VLFLYSILPVHNATISVKATRGCHPSTLHKTLIILVFFGLIVSSSVAALSIIVNLYLNADE